MSQLNVGNRSVEISNQDKVLFPKDGITKGDLIAYYRQIAETMLPYLEDRPVAMHRFPDGIGEGGFYQKNVSDYFPGWIETVEVGKEGGSVMHALCNDAATLVYLANQACITPHTWLSRRDKLDYPDVMVFDLDPSGDDFSIVRKGALKLKDLLDELALPSFVQTTGSRGLHVFVALDRSEDFDSVRAFARDLAEVIVRREPKHFTVEQRKEKRGDRVFIDTLRNAYAQTAVAPYSVRPKPGAPVATPLEWREVGKSGLGPQDYSLRNVFRRLSQKGEPWGGRAMWRDAASLSEARRKLASISPG